MAKLKKKIRWRDAENLVRKAPHKGRSWKEHFISYSMTYKTSHDFQ